MDFKEDKPIYLQIVDFCFRKMVTGEWKEEERIPSVRELGTLLQVNPNTAMRSYEYMQVEGIIYLKRGMGYYVCTGAQEIIREIQRNEFFETTLPDTFDRMKLLGIGIEEIVVKYKSLNK
ncbi:MAG: GntR family transcriptional regulator [Tannerellaceae bacterium]|nr:GntR family transcriptional regulator [Tannerellaceae bacterium]